MKFGIKNSVGWAALLVVCFFWTSPVLGQTSILYWTDGVAGDDAMAGAISSLAASEDFDFTATTATDDADFTAKIGSGNYDLGVLFIQMSDTEYASIDALADFVDNGGLAMYSDWTARVDSTGANARAARFGFQYTGVFNEDGVTITDPLLNSPFALQSPLSLASPGWQDISFGLSVDEADGISLAEFGNGDAAVVRTFPGGRVMGFGMLNDTFADNDEGVEFFTNALVAIPEPATYAVLFGVIVLAGACARRRRVF